MDAAYACFLLLGTGALLPWNCLITAADYWESRFPVRWLLGGAAPAAEVL